MSVSASFSKSKTNQLINYLIEQYGVPEDYNEIVEHALQEGWIKTAKDKNTSGDGPKQGRKSAEKGQSKWTAYQRWAKKWSAWNDTPLDRDTMKEIYASYDETELKEWQRVAEELNAGKDIRDIENKPEIRMPKPKEQEPEQELEQEPASQETELAEEPETQEQGEFEAMDLNGDGVVDRAEFEAHKAQEELSEIEQLKAKLAAAEAKVSK